MSGKGEKFREQDEEGRSMGRMKEEHIQRWRREQRDQNLCEHLGEGPCFSRYFWMVERSHLS